MGRKIESINPNYFPAPIFLPMNKDASSLRAQYRATFHGTEVAYFCRQLWAGILKLKIPIIFLPPFSCP
jgi:transposase